MTEASELPIQTGVSAMQLAEAMFGTGIQILNATYNGDPLSAGIYTQGDTIAPAVTPADSGVILSTGRAADFTNASGDVNISAGTTTDTAGVDGDSSMNELAGAATFDGAIFQADFIPAGSTLTMQITFSSEEYLEYVGSGFNDAVGVWVNGQKAELTVGNGDISIDNINPTTNSNLYVDNANDVYNTEMDGFTVTLTLKAPVVPGEVNTIKIGIADGGDTAYDSNLLIAGASVQTAVIAQDDAFTVARNNLTEVDLVANDTNTAGGTLTITKINGIPVTAGDYVILPSGLGIVVNADGTITAVAEGEDALGEASFSYEVMNQDGITDVGFVSGEVVPCFVQGTRIETVRGPVPVEDIAVGDLVLTLDHGFQPVVWHGVRQVPSRGAMAAVRIPAGAFGDHGALSVSPQHRLHFSGWRAQLYAGEDEVLVKAIHLVRAGRLAQDHSGAMVTYHHLLFGRHEILCAEGMWSESYYPGPTTLAGHDAEVQEELLALFPELAADPAKYGPSARTEVRAHVAALLVA
ncbi:choice-of-anchor L domain-containing protein [Tabrizicola aquatica]|uniref:choice-of-anchor L domain-containing protein n=1 Tax=Tabrizicola aquatica TaxID=909926 RepID=UPI000CD28EFD|nr:choice-of-anchor L domain-containing protein [Tabrizicola aquatica]